MLLFLFGALTLVVLDAIVVGMDMLIKKYGETNKGKKRMCLITNALCPIKDSDAGTKEDQVGLIAMRMSALGMKMENIVVRGSLSGNANKRIMDENDLLLDLFSKKSSVKTIYVDSPTALLGAIKTRNISPVTIFRGDLEISPNMKIKVRYFWPLHNICQAYLIYLFTYYFVRVYMCFINICFPFLIYKLQKQPL